MFLLLNGVALVRLYSEAKTFTMEKIVVYHVSGETLVDYLFRGMLITVKNTTLAEEKEAQIAGAFRKRHRIQRAETWYIRETDGRLPLGNFEGRIVRSKEQAVVGIPVERSPDFILLCENPPVSPVGQENAGVLIADASNWRKNVSSWKEASTQKGWNFVDIRETGSHQLIFKPKRFAFPPRLSRTNREID
ncbi:MAG: hypothetical protein IPJ40_17730 [Saprospirales bacterium]|nr:hypothetical protein [Saprospirales bacterium]